MNITNERAIELAMSNLMAITNQRDRGQRVLAIQKTYSPNVALYEPDNVVVGHQAVDNVFEKLLEGSPGWNFKPSGPVKRNHNMITMPWHFGPSENPARLTGSDVILVGDDGLIALVYVVIDPVSTLGLGIQET